MQFSTAPGVVALGSGDRPISTATVGDCTSGNPSAVPPVLPSEIWAADMNMVLYELCNVVTAAGLTLSTVTLNQVATAIGVMINDKIFVPEYIPEGSNTVALTTTQIDASAIIVINGTPAGTVTVNFPAGAGWSGILRNATAQPLSVAVTGQAGDVAETPGTIPPTTVLAYSSKEIWSDGAAVYLATADGGDLNIANNSSITGIPTLIANAIAAIPHGVEYFGQGAMTWTVPAGVYSVKIWLCGAAGGGGGGVASAAGGGGAGGSVLRIAEQVVPGQVLAGGIGAGGAGGAAGAGGAQGGTTTFAGRSLTGGAGGTGGTSGSALGLGGNIGSVSGLVAGDVSLGAGDGTAGSSSGGIYMGGAGGFPNFIGGAGASGSLGNGASGLGPGAGGAGGANGTPGGPGGDGAVLIEW